MVQGTFLTACEEHMDTCLRNASPIYVTGNQTFLNKILTAERMRSAALLRAKRLPRIPEDDALDFDSTGKLCSPSLPSPQTSPFEVVISFSPFFSAKRHKVESKPVMELKPTVVKLSTPETSSSPSSPVLSIPSLSSKQSSYKDACYSRALRFI